MHNSNTRSKTIKKKLNKCKYTFYAYSDLQFHYGNTLDLNEDIIEIKCNVKLVGCDLGDSFTSDFVGILAGVLVLLSFVFKNIKTIRLTNIIASMVFVVYGVMIGSQGLPLIFTNGILVLVHIYYLSKIFSDERKLKKNNIV